jgi:hypothetical protein
MTIAVVSSFIVGTIMFALGAVWGSRVNYDLELKNARLRSQLEMLGQKTEGE